MKPPPWRLDRAVYPHFTEVMTRYRDEDALRHVNNLAVAGFHDEGRNRFSHAVFARAGDITGTRLVTAETRVTFLAEVFHPDLLEVGSGILKIGRTSYQIGQGLFQRGRCVGLCTAVFVSATKAGTRPLPENLLEVLEAFRLLAPEGSEEV